MAVDVELFGDFRVARNQPDQRHHQADDVDGLARLVERQPQFVGVVGANKGVAGQDKKEHAAQSGQQRPDQAPAIAQAHAQVAVEQAAQLVSPVDLLQRRGLRRASDGLARRRQVQAIEPLVARFVVLEDFGPAVERRRFLLFW